MLILQLLWYNTCTTEEVCNTTSTQPRPLHWSIVVDHREQHWTAALSGPSGAVPTWPDGAWLDGLLWQGPWGVHETCPSRLLYSIPDSNSDFKMVGQRSKLWCLKKQKAINMSKYPFARLPLKILCSAAWVAKAFLLEPLQSFLWDWLVEFIVWSATAGTQNTSK